MAALFFTMTRSIVPRSASVWSASIWSVGTALSDSGSSTASVNDARAAMVKGGLGQGVGQTLEFITIQAAVMICIEQIKDNRCSERSDRFCWTSRATVSGSVVAEFGRTKRRTTERAETLTSRTTKW